MNGFLARVASFINALVGLAIITAGGCRHWVECKRAVGNPRAVYGA